MFVSIVIRLFCKLNNLIVFFFIIIRTHNLPVHQAICFCFLPDAFFMSRSCATIP